MHDDRVLVEQRVRRVLSDRIWPAMHRWSAPLTVEVWHAPGEPVSVAEAPAAPYEEFAVGQTWGPAWSTSWFRVRGRVPQEWAGCRVEAVVDLDTYGSELAPSELAHAVRNYAEKGRSNVSLAPFGYGDGGGGPTREMLERARRLRDLEGAPRLRIEAPSTFFDEATRSTRMRPSGPGSSTSSGIGAPSRHRPAPRQATGAASVC